MLLAHCRRNDELGKLFSERFLPTKSKNTFRRRIEFKDPASGVHGYDAIEGVVDDPAIKHLELGIRLNSICLDARF